MKYFSRTRSLLNSRLVGLVSGLKHGGVAAIFHYSLRYTLARTNRAPWNYTRFLDHCTERIFLRKVGGGYIFIHRLLQEHFAALTPEDIERLSKSE